MEVKMVGSRLGKKGNEIGNWIKKRRRSRDGRAHKIKEQVWE